LKWFLGPQEVGWRGVERSTKWYPEFEEQSWRRKSKSKRKELDLNSKMDATALAGNEFQRSLLLLVGAGVFALVY
jgi:hypothetical protein